MILVSSLRYTQQYNIADLVDENYGVVYIFKNDNGSFKVVQGLSLNFFTTM